MPVNITTPQTKTFYVDESNQGWVLTSSGSITSADGHGIVNNDAFHDSTITVAGDIVANAMYTKAGFFPTARVPPSRSRPGEASMAMAAFPFTARTPKSKTSAR